MAWVDDLKRIWIAGGGPAHRKAWRDLLEREEAVDPQNPYRRSIIQHASYIARHNPFYPAMVLSGANVELESRLHRDAAQAVRANLAKAGRLDLGEAYLWRVFGVDDVRRSAMVDSGDPFDWMLGDEFDSVALRGILGASDHLRILREMQRDIDFILFHAEDNPWEQVLPWAG